MGWWTYDNYMNAGSQDNSYKIKTERNSNYNGYYSLLKLDENGNNTWDGLLLRVDNDKIIGAVLVEYDSYETIKERGNLDDDVSKGVLDNKEISQAMKEALMDDKDFPLTEEERDNSYEWAFLSGISDTSNGYYYARAYVVYINDRKVDINKEKRYLDFLDITPAYDEDSQELWLSKLLSNENSIYHEGYKLTHYTEHMDWVDYVHD